jgi:hypothetical protein
MIPEQFPQITLLLSLHSPQPLFLRNDKRKRRRRTVIWDVLISICDYKKATITCCTKKACALSCTETRKTFKKKRKV